MWQMLPGLVALLSGEFGRALEPFERALKSDPQNPMLRLVHAQILALNLRTDEAIERLEAMSSGAGDTFFTQLARFYLYALRRDKDAALGCVNQQLTNAAMADMNYAWIMAQAYALIGEVQTSLEWLNSAVERGFINFPLLHHLDPFLQNVRGEPGFGILMQSTRQQWEAFEV
jgi:non-specific serine/threonine protein kinase